MLLYFRVCCSDTEDGDPDQKMSCAHVLPGALMIFSAVTPWNSCETASHMLVSTKPEISFTPTSQYSHFVFIIKNTSPHSFISLRRHLLVHSSRTLHPHLALSITTPPCSSHACHALPFIALLFPLPGIAPSLFS